MSKFLLLVTFLSMSQTVLASLSPGEIQTKIASLSPMPETPTTTGSRFGYYHLLEKLRKGIEVWLNPANPDNYLYRSTPSLAIDTSEEFLAHVELYERLMKDYLELLGSGEIDRYAPLGVRWSSGEEILFPSRYDLPAEVAEKLAGHSFSTHHQFSKVLTILYKQLWDHRFISQSLFSVTVRPGHRPMEGINSLSRSSSKSQMLLDRIMGRLRLAISHVSSDYVTLSRKILSGDTNWDLRRQILNADFKQQELNHRLTYLTHSIYRAVQFANDIVRDKKIGLSDLEKVAAHLGDQLHESISDIGVFRNELNQIGHIDGAVPQRRGPMGVRLTDTYGELIRILGLQGHIMGISVFNDLKQRNPELPYQMFRDTVTLQYILAMGSAMAKIAEISEGRGNWRQRLAQEVSFRRAQITGGGDTTGTSLIVLDQRDPEMPQIQRRDFAAPELSSKRTEIEERLWKIFFDHAQLDLTNPSTCGRSLIQ